MVFEPTPGPAQHLRTRALGAHLRALREAKGWTLQDLAERTGLPVSVVSAYETGTRTPGRVVLRRLATVFDVDVVSLSALAAQRNG